ncbi:hypothetical protein B566_EDAN001725 [Ephemera danica]|nr:hypothetical protein B566_EDAN001725 [Ephemera danica]
MRFWKACQRCVAMLYTNMVLLQISKGINVLTAQWAVELLPGSKITSECTLVYVWPGIDELPSQQRLLISKIVDDEKQKTELVPDFQVTKLKITEKPKLNGSDEKLKPKLNEKDIVEQDVDKKLLTSTTTKVTPGVPKYCMENQDFLIINDPDSTLIDQTDIKFNIDHHPSTQDAKVSSLENNTFLTEDSCVKNVNREITLGDDSSVLKTTPTVNTKSQLPLLMCNSLNSHPKQVYPTGQPINSSSECCSTATTSVLSDTAQIVPSPDLSQQLCGKNEIHKQEEAKDDESLSNPNITFKGVVQEATMIVDKTQNINNISNDKPFVTDLPQGSGINAQPKTSTQLQNTKRLLRHNKTHSGIHYFACDICKKTFLEKYNLSVHMRTHTGSRPFQCDECGKTMRYHQEFEDHKRVHRGEIPFICPQCPKQSFVRAKDFKRHMKSKHQPSDARKDAVEAHIKKIHNRELHPTFQCTVCEHKFLSENLLQQHRLLHSGHKGHVCTQCGKSFATKAYLQKHLRVHELRKFNVPCPNCPRTFTSNENVMIHQKTFHDKNAMLKLQAQNPQSENYSPGIPTSDCFVQVESDDNLEAELDLTQLQQLGPVDGDKDIHVVFLQVLSDANL